uniref:Ras association domain-containing protein 8 n=1 Tax=Aceria tosichella TaxID=561515 RepID=A0A6G1SQI7_9ACAR
MELRVWVDGTQRVVCGVKLTTTCQEIVFALAHATQQAGRFTMIERWRNNERLLSPNEQPLVTLQRWGDRMNEVEFILKRTSTDPPSQTDRTPVTQMLNHNQSLPTTTNAPQQTKELPPRITSDNDANHQSTLTNGHGGSPSNHMLSTSKQQQQSINDQLPDTMFQQSRQYNPTRRPQTVLGPLTSSNSALNLGSNYMQAQMNRFSSPFRPSLSASTLPNVTNNMTASPSSSASMLRPLYPDDTAVGTRSPSMLKNDPHNGYPIQNESQQYQSQQLANQPRINSITKNYPHEDLYGTINKKRINHIPPAVPAKPRLVNPLANQTHSQSIQTINKAQMNYYQPNQSTVTMYNANVRPRHPPGYLEYLEAMANRNSLPQPLMSNANYPHQAQILQSNIFNRQLDQQQLYQQNGSSPAGSTTSACYPVNGQSDRASFGTNYDVGATTTNLQNVNPINPKFVESSGIVMNRGSAVNVKLHSNSQFTSSQNASNVNETLDNSVQSNNSSVSQMGHDMLKVIEEQKKVLMNQKNELERLDNDQEYLEAKQNSEQAELINRIESEIQQLEELWSENQAQIKKLENQDFESELHHLKDEQLRMEAELASQKKKLFRFETDIAECHAKIERLEAELGSLNSESEESIIDSEKSIDDKNDVSAKADLKTPLIKSNGSSDSVTNQNSDLKNLKCSDDEDYENDSSGDASDDLSTKHSDSKLRNTKEVPYVEKRGLISGIRSLKLDKSRSLNKSVESINSNDLSLSRSNNTSPPLARQQPPSNINNNIIESRCSGSNGQQFGEKTVSSNKYEFLMTL